MNRMIAAEFRRLYYTRLGRWWLPIAVLAGLGFTGLLAVLGPQNMDPPMPGLDTAEGVRGVLGILGFTMIVPALLGTVAVTGEYRHGSVTSTFGFVPRRWRVLIAKLSCYALAGAGYGTGFAVGAAAGLYGGAAITGVHLGLNAGTLAVLLLRIAVAMTGYTLIGVAVGALVRNQIAAVVVIIGYLQFGEVLLLVIPGVNRVYPFLPGGATASLTDFGYITGAVADQTASTATEMLSAPWGAAVLAGYVAAAAIAATAVPLRRDVA